MNVGDLLKIKGFNAVTIKPDESIADVARLLRQERIGAVIVSKDGKHIDGIISERDIAYALSEHLGTLHTLQVSQLMTRAVVTCGPADSVAEISRVMTWRGFRHLPVIENGEVVGILSMRDVLRNRIADLERVAGMLRSAIIATE